MNTCIRAEEWQKKPMKGNKMSTDLEVPTVEEWINNRDRREENLKNLDLRNVIRRIKNGFNQETILFNNLGFIKNKLAQKGFYVKEIGYEKDLVSISWSEKK